jgi:putrescine aminotransferase
MLGRVSRRLAEIAPGDLQISFWCNSGTEAIEGAIKLARAATGRAKIVSTSGAFHGKTMGALSVSGRETFQAPFRPLLDGFAQVPYGDAAALDAALADAAAFVVEPVQGEGGVNVPPAGYLRAVRRVTAAARCSSPTKCRPDWDAAATALPAIATGSFPT